MKFYIFVMLASLVAVSSCSPVPSQDICQPGVNNKLKCYKNEFILHNGENYLCRKGSFAGNRATLKYNYNDNTLTFGPICKPNSSKLCSTPTFSIYKGSKALADGKDELWPKAELKMMGRSVWFRTASLKDPESEGCIFSPLSEHEL